MWEKPSFCPPDGKAPLPPFLGDVPAPYLLAASVIRVRASSLFREAARLPEAGVQPWLEASGAAAEEVRSRRPCAQLIRSLSLKPQQAWVLGTEMWGGEVTSILAPHSPER